jgi:hypothetical protein
LSYLIERRTDSGFDSTKSDTHYPTKVGGSFLLASKQVKEDVDAFLPSLSLRSEEGVSCFEG